MNAISQIFLFQKFAAVGVDLTGRALGYGLAMVLIATWLATTPLLHLGVYLGDLSRKRISSKR